MSLNSVLLLAITLVMVAALVVHCHQQHGHHEVVGFRSTDLLGDSNNARMSDASSFQKELELEFVFNDNEDNHPVPSWSDRLFHMLVRSEDDDDEALEQDLVPAPAPCEAEQQEQTQTEKRKLQDSSSSSSRVNIFQKLGESIGQAIIGFLLIILVPCLIWKNEGRNAFALSRIDFCKNEAVAIDCQEPGEENVGRVVHFVGTVSVGNESSSSLQFDPQSTGASLNTTRGVPRALLLKRTCYIYQRFEQTSRQVQNDRLGGGETRTTTYTLKEDWTPMGPQPPSLPHLPEHTNTRGIWDQLVSAAGPSANGGASPVPSMDQMPPELRAQLGLYDANQAPHGMMISHTAHVGEFGLTREVVAQNPSVFLDPSPSMAQNPMSFLTAPPATAAEGQEAPPKPPSFLKKVPNTFLPDQFPDCPELQKGSDNVLRTFPENEQPRNGDIKVEFEFAVDGFEASFVVVQNTAQAKAAEAEDEMDKVEKAADDEAALPKYRVDQAKVTSKCAGTDMGSIWMVRRGRHTLEEMVVMAKADETKTTKVLRLICLILLCAGWSMVRNNNNKKQEQQLDSRRMASSLAMIIIVVLTTTLRFLFPITISCLPLLRLPCPSCPFWDRLGMRPSLWPP
jgi:hypothetical protein